MEPRWNKRKFCLKWNDTYLSWYIWKHVVLCRTDKTVQATERKNKQHEKLFSMMTERNCYQLTRLHLNFRRPHDDFFVISKYFFIKAIERVLNTQNIKAQSASLVEILSTELQASRETCWFWFLNSLMRRFNCGSRNDRKNTSSGKSRGEEVKTKLESLGTFRF